MHSSKILLCWELGGGAGHLVSLRTIAAALSHAGHQCVLCVPQGTNPALLRPTVTGAESDGSGQPFSVVETLPISPPKQMERPFQAASFADVLGQIGFANADALTRRVKMWRDLFVQHQADLILGDFSPIACFAARGLVPSLSIGNGYSTPPSDRDDFPVLNPHVPPTYSLPTIGQNALDVASRLGFANVLGTTSLPSLISADQSLIRCYRYFDPYAAFRNEQVLGPLDPTDPVVRQTSEDWPDRFYAYLSGDYPYIGEVLNGLLQSNVRGDLFVKRLRPELRDRLANSNLRVVTEMAVWKTVVPSISFVVHHSGLGTAQACAAMGIPQLVIPSHLEHELTGMSVLKLRIGAALVPPFTAADVAMGVQSLLTNPAYRTAASEVASRIAAEGPYCFVDRVIESVEDNL